MPVTFPKFEPPWKSFPPPEVSVRPWVITFSIICSTGAVSLFVYTALGYYASLQASRSLFLRMLKRLVRAPPRFLDITPVGRILNRFTAGIVLAPHTCSQSDRGLRHRDRGWGTPELRARCDCWNAQLRYIVLGHHLGCAKFHTCGTYPCLVLHQNWPTLHQSFERSQAVGINISVPCLLRV